MWTRMRDAQDRMGVKNMSDLVLKEIYDICKTKTSQKSNLKDTRLVKEEFLKNMII